MPDAGRDREYKHCSQFGGGGGETGVAVNKILKDRIISKDTK